MENELLEKFKTDIKWHEWNHSSPLNLFEINIAFILFLILTQPERSSTKTKPNSMTSLVSTENNGEVLKKTHVIKISEEEKISKFLNVGFVNYRIAT